MGFKIAVLHLMILWLSSVSNASTIARPFLYEIKDGNTKSYMLGTIHGGVSFNQLPNFVKEAFSNSKTVLFEWALDSETANLTIRNLPQALYKYGVFTGEPLSREEKRLLVRKWNVPVYLADVATSENCNLITYLAGVSSGFMDVHLMKFSYEMNKEIIQLDSEEIFAELSSQSDGSDDCDLRKLVLVDKREYKNELNKVVLSYVRGQEAHFSKVNKDSVFRNLKWMPTIELNLKKSPFIAVGVGHLFGEQGLINLLRQKGYQIRRIDNASQL